ncbi:GMC family oxidoreductase N-terminal domain-containing protein [Nonomuraea sp. NPDC050404]|uniref:GMC family oxidoreductase n=1 Tax=Nonomuraea sp. NPDC050404 TaxID=3155783 RepID=UPI0033F9BBFA
MTPAALAGMGLDHEVPTEADYVIVGAGPAGCVLAARLSEDPRCRVVLLEAGATTGAEPAARTPWLSFSLMAGPTAWPDLTAPQPALGGRQVYLAQGRGLGGGSSMNMMAWFHGHPADYDTWAATGAAGWSWDDVAPTFRALESGEFGPDRWHGTGGPMTVTRARDVSPLPLTFLAAGKETGWPITDDFNGATREGVGLFAANVRDGARHSAVDAYLAPAAHRPNLAVRTGVHVTAIDLDGTRATGVRHTREAGGTTTAGETHATRGVILAAGALRSPQLLMLSGIGPAAHLAEHAIGVRHDLPGVGANLQDHPMLSPSWPVTDGSPLRNAISAQDERAYALARRGPLASVSQAGAMLSTEPDLPGPDIQVTLTLLGLDAQLRVLDQPVVTAAISLLAPRSRGVLRLVSADPRVAPIADPAYLCDPDDRARMRAGLRLVKQLFDTPSLKAATGAPLQPSRWDDDSLDSWIAATAGTEWHPAGTCRMGTGPATVVNPATMAVHGLKALYVADSSTMPTVPRGNTQAPVIMLAERAAKRIKVRNS